MRPSLPAQAFSDYGVDEATRRRDMGMKKPARPRWALRQERLNRGWSEHQLAKELTDLACRLEERGWRLDGNTVGRWERGIQNPGPSYVRLLCLLFDRSAQELGLLEGIEPDPDGTSEALELAQLAASSDVGPEMIELTQEAVVRLRRRYSSQPSSILVGELRQRLRIVGRLLAGKMTLHQHSDLLQAGGWLALLLATTSWDLKQRENAYAYRDLAWQWSRQTGDRELEAWSLETPAWFALIDKRYGEAAELSQAAQRLLPESPVAVASLLQEGRAWARLGARSESLEAISRASTVLERIPPADHPDDHYQVDPSKWQFIAGTVNALLGQSRAAEKHARAVIAANDPQSVNYWPARVAIAHIDLGLALAQHSDFDEAASEGAQAFESPVCHRSTMQRAGELDLVLAAHSEVSQVRDFHERYASAQEAGIP